MKLLYKRNATKINIILGDFLHDSFKYKNVINIYVYIYSYSNNNI